MMYSNYQLENNPSFKMTRKEFNTLVNSLTKEPTENSKPVRVGLTIRTATSNLVAKHYDEIVLPIELDPNLGEGYFNVLTNIQKMLIDTFGIINMDVSRSVVILWCLIIIE